MPDIIQFIPKNECDAAHNLKGFIDLCRNKLTIFGADLDWDAGVWDVTPWVFISGRKGRMALTWSNHDSSKQKMGALLSLPFLNFAKSYMRYQHGMKPTKTVGFRLSALRALERSLMELHGDSKVEKADAEVFNRSAQLIRDKFKSSTSYRIGSQLGMISHFLVENKLVAHAFIWKNPLKRSQDKNRVGKKADEDRLNKLPSEAGLAALPHVYNLATEAPDIISTSIVAVLCGASDRINEVFRLPVNCEVHENLLDAEEQLERAEQAIEKGSAGADRWLVHHQLTVKRLRNLWAILSDPKVPEGAVIQLSNDKEFSPIRVAMEDKVQIKNADSQMLSRIRALSQSKVKALQETKTKS